MYISFSVDTNHDDAGRDSSYTPDLLPSCITLSSPAWKKACIFLTSEASKIKRELGDSNESSEDTQSSYSSNEGPRNVRIDAYAEGNYTIFSLSHLHPNKDQYRYKTYLMACDSGSGFGNWENVLNKSLKRRFKADPYTNVTIEVREQTTGKIIAKNSTVTPAKEPEANVTSLECNQVKCQAIVENECSKYNGYNITVQFTLKPSCDKLKNPLITHAAVVSSQTVRVALRDLDLVPFTNYTATAKLANNVGAATDPSLTRETFFISKSESPGRVSSLNVTHSTPYSLHVVWSAPDDDPPKGKLSEYKLEWKIRGVSTNKENVIVNESVTSFNITGLQQNTTYDIKIVAKNAQISSYGEAFSITATTKDEGPYSEYFSCKPRIMRTAKRPKGPAILGMIVGMCFAAIFLICIFTMLVVKFRKPSRKKLPDNGYFNPVDKEDNSIINSVEQGGGVMIMPEDDILPKDNKKKPEDDEKDAPQEDLYANLNHEVSKEDLEQYLPRAIYASETTMEFNSVPFFMTGKTTSGSRIPENVPKNRYKNNISYDDTRVKLPLYLNIPHSDYINANFVQDPSGSAAFIATQGPKDHSVDTIGAFWRMIWHSECRLILMVANLVEGGKIKVAQYWPEEEPMVKEGVKVTLTSVQILMDYAVRTFTVAVDGKERKVKQYHYMAWPDHGVPQTAYGLGYMLKAVIGDYAVEPQGPITVHCSAGIGRTGTIILTLFLLRQLRTCDAINTKKALHTLREGRGRLVENEEQYIFVHKLLYDILFGMRTTFSCQSFVREAAAIRSSKASDGTLILQKEYEKMKKLPKDLTFKRGNDPACAHLNRNQAILPADKRMMFVQMYGTGNDSQYVNIIRVHGFDRKDAYMAGEHPQPHTLAKIWRLVYEQRVSVWLLLQELPHNDPSFPNVVRETSAVPGNMTLEISQPTHLENFTEYTAILTVKERECWRNHKCTLLMLSGWSHTAKLPSSPVPLLGAIEKAESLQLPQTPLLFTCSDGVTACGVMASLLLAVCRAKLTQEVDLYRSAVSVQYDRPQFITNLMQYQFLFTAMEAFLNENKHYGNFT
ncbi:receptor-type tyrosine-protein phosphatase epsilon-like isoform X3 [Scylla paramamosain]|uniref:receptor-type tyrosine-protein phosphatase epsilon-like isoform X3 n=1 Tax=Scylla paramamosain TaxID=85552 RepID=UPI0030833AA0